jgi:hypothetical protein
MNFDWYGASLDASHDETLGEAAGAFEISDWQHIKPRYGFGQAMAARAGNRTLFEVLWENRGQLEDDRKGTCFVQGTGCHAAPVAKWLREWQPRHRVARADVAEDFSGEGSWDCLAGISLDVADLYDVKVEHAGDHHRAIDGRSLYVGGRTSVVREIVYEKGKQLGDDPDWVRVELRVRPGSRVAKYQAAQLSAGELYGASVWSKELATRLSHPEVARLSLGTVYRESDVFRARNALLAQYGHTLRQWKGELGSWSALADELALRLPDEI